MEVKNNTSMDDRKRLWEIMFGSEPLPKIVPNAAELFAGSCSKDLNLTKDSFQYAIDQIDLD